MGHKMPDGGIVPQYLTLDLDHAIENWAAWSRTRRGVAHCASIEGNYRHPRHRTTTVGPSIDVNSALSVERAMCEIPRDHQLALIFHYVWRSPSSYICRKLGLNRTAWDRYLTDARTMLKNLLLRQGKWRIQSADNPTSSS